MRSSIRVIENFRYISIGY